MKKTQASTNGTGSIKDGNDTKPTDSKAYGKTNGPTVPRETEKSKTTQFPSRWVCAAVALLAFAGGIWTKPLLSHPAVVSARRRLFLGDDGVQLETRPAVPEKPKCGKFALSQFLHQDPVVGMHVVCLAKITEDKAELRIFAEAKEGPSEMVLAGSNWSSVRDALTETLELDESDELHQPWAVFSSVGARIADEQRTADDGVMRQLFESGLVVLFEGGQWMWPGVRVGFRRTIDLYTVIPGDPPKIDLPKKRKATLETLSLQPLVLGVDGFLSDEECTHVQKTALPSMRQSSVQFTDADQGKDEAEFRTSSNTFIYAKDNMLKDIDYRTASLVRIPRQHQEQVQVLRYERTQHYVAHHDYFNKEFYQKDAGTLRMIQNGRRNRMATVFWYLSNVEKGGETVFPRWNGAPQPTDFGDCSVGLKVKPVRGKVIIFYSMTADGALDELSMHGACPVEEGVKWAANKWVWNLPTNYIED